MTDSILTLALDFSRPDCPAVVQCKQEDTGRILKITLSDAGIPYTITEDCYAVFTAVKPDGTILHNPCQVEGNTVLYRFTEQTCAAVGTMVCEIKLYGADDRLLTSAGFLMEVHKTVFRNGDPVVSESEVNTLKHLISEANAVLSEVESEAEQIVAKLSSGAVEVFNRNAAERTEELNRHAGQLLDDAEAAFNRNAAEKTAEFDRHAGELQQSVAELQTTQELTSTAIGAVRDDISELRTAQAETMAAFSGTDRRLNYLWKKNAGILYDTEMVTGSGSVVPVPSGAMAVACLNRIGCMSRKGKNLLNPTLNTTTKNGITCTKNADGTYTVNGTASASTYLELIRNFPFDTGKQYRLTGCPSGGSTSTYQLLLQDTSDSTNWPTLAGNTGKGVTFQVDAPSNILRIMVYKNATLDNLVFKPMITEDLSAGYDDYEAYADHLIHAGVDKITSVNGTGAAIEEKPIPQAIRDACPDYGIGVNENCYNYIDLAEKTYHHRVSRIDMGSLNYSKFDGVKTAYFRALSTVPDMVRLSSAATNPNFLSNRYATTNAVAIYQTDIDMVIGLQADTGSSTANKIWIRDLSCADASALKSALSGVMLCYELAEEEIIDLSSVWGDFDERIAVEAGGSLRLHYPEKDSGYEVAVPSRTEIMVNVSEVGA